MKKRKVEELTATSTATENMESAHTEELNPNLESKVVAEMIGLDYLVSISENQLAELNRQEDRGDVVTNTLQMGEIHEEKDMQIS